MNIQRFNFTEFGEATVPKAVKSKQFVGMREEKEEVPLPPPAPVFNEDDIKAAEKEGYKKGFAAGVQDGRNQAASEQAEIDRKLTAAAEKFIRFLAPVFEDYSRTIVHMRESLPKIALTVARKIAGPALDVNAMAVVEEMAQRVCETMSGEPKLTITVHESLADTLQQRIEQLASRLPEEIDIVILRDPDIALADCRIEWHHGVIERNTEQLWQQVEQVIGNLSLIEKRDAAGQMETLQAQLPMEPQHTENKE